MPPVSPDRISLPDRYRVIRHLANGGMASVWEAHDELLDRAVAVKLLASHLGEDDRARRRFQREARAAAGLSSHPHVVTIYDVGEHQARVFMVMEIMRGGTVGDAMKSGREIPLKIRLRWLREAAGALDTAHAAGVVHRDIKPGNLLLDDHDRLAVGDFGIARVAWEDQLTATGQVLGTAAYLSPEQAMGEPATAASDIYALAVVAYELLTGSRPFEAEHFAAQARAHIEDPVPAASTRAPELSRAVDAVLERGLAKEPGDRWESAEAFVAALERTVDADAPSTEPTRKLGRREKRARGAGWRGGRRGLAGEDERGGRPPSDAGRSGRARRRGPATPPATRRTGTAVAPRATDRAGAGGAPQRRAADRGARRAHPARGRRRVRARQPRRRRRADPAGRAAHGRADARVHAGADARGHGDAGADPGRDRHAGADPEDTPTPEPTPAETPEEPSGEPDLKAAQAAQLEGYNARRAGDFQTALTKAREAQQLCAGSKELSPCGYALFEEGVALIGLGQPEAAIAPLQRRLDEFGDNDSGEVRRALRDAKKAARGRPSAAR